MKLRSLAIIFILIVSMAPAWYANKYLQKIIAPRASLARLFLYLLSGAALVFVYTWLMVWIISKLFPLPLK